MLFLTFPFKFYKYKKFKLSTKDYLYVYVYDNIAKDDNSYQTRILSAGLGMAWNREGLSCVYLCVLKNLFCFSTHL